MTDIYIGVDPGKKGSYAVIDGTEALAWPWDDIGFIVTMQTVKEQAREQGRNVFACVEKVGAMPHQGVSSTFTFGKSAGYIEGVLSTVGIPYQLIPPTQWKREFGLLHTEKTASVTVAKRLFPKVNLMPTARSRKESDGLADALLMAEFGRRKF